MAWLGLFSRQLYAAVIVRVLRFDPDKKSRPVNVGAAFALQAWIATPWAGNVGRVRCLHREMCVFAVAQDRDVTVRHHASQVERVRFVGVTDRQRLKERED